MICVLYVLFDESSEFFLHIIKDYSLAISMNLALD